ncbi:MULTISPECIES: hypothetical protein [unclassified Streptomyces]|uniref:hypothetical protein n=1 Tax=unclassified Streptomyces TaxID=2593676 RepID=UPI002255F240|nr:MULTISPECIES: hypothetical protein [unclassified Streptomyces]MCX4884238.1 hypothetical protein [Streptomyces sp. NBC_00847]MCX5424356.1 hypothetical protein [Streptomyces sp. NBC_00078]
MAAALLTAGCSRSPDTAPPRSLPASSSPPPSASTARPSATATSAFCLDLSTFQVGVIAYRSEVGAAIEGQPLDFKGLRRKAALIADIGERMRSSAPPDIAEEFRTVLKAIDTSASNLKSDAEARDVLDPVYGERNRPAFDAVDHYDCGAEGG